MTPTDDLLRQFRASGSESAFRALVDRYVDLVYSVAVRGMNGDTHAAEDVTQKVFADLARLAANFPERMQLGGWLHRHTCFVAGTLRRGEQRRAAREREAVAMNLLQVDSTNSRQHWTELAPILDDAINQLDDDARDALVLRFFEQRDFKSIGAALGVSDDTAQKRVSRALDRLRTLLQARGIGTATAALGVLLTEQAVTAAPAGLAANASAQALAINTAATTATAGAFGLTLATLFKWGAAAAVATALVGTGIWVTQKPVQSDTKASAAPAATTSAAPKAATSPSASQSLVPTAKTANILPGADTNLLHLTFVTADTGTPVPNVAVEWRAREREHPLPFSVKQFVANRLGVCDVPVPREDILWLQLTSQSDGFANTQLRWVPAEGDMIGTNYVVRLDRAVPIGGFVVDPDGKPVSGAKLVFRYVAEAKENPLFDAHKLGYIDLASDSEGKWQVNRIGADMIARLGVMAIHPEYTASSEISVKRNPQADFDLRAGKQILKLGRADTIRGIVVDTDGRPLAQATVRAGHPQMLAKRTTTTNAKGEFTLTGCDPREKFLTAEAEGFAPTALELTDTRNTQTHRLVLSSGKTLRLRVVNPKGQPVPDAYVQFNASMKPDAAGPCPQVDFFSRTDTEGRMAWTNAPDRPLSFSISATDSVRLESYQVIPDGEEHVVTLPAALVIQGTVSDAETGKPLPRFRMVRGRMEVGKSWQQFEPDGFNFADGRFRHVVKQNSGQLLVFRFEAEDYASAISRVVDFAEGTVQLDIVLKRAPASTITILQPDGKPAREAEVALVVPLSRYVLFPGGFTSPSDNGRVKRTGPTGQFRLPSDPTISHIVVSHRLGYGEATVEALNENPVLKLEPWGRVEGNFAQQGKPQKDVTISLGFVETTSALFLDSNTFNTKTDAQGHFNFPKVPPGLFSLRQKADPGTMFAYGPPLATVSVESGMTAMAQIEIQSYTLAGKIQSSVGQLLEPGSQLDLLLIGPLLAPETEPQIRHSRRVSIKQRPDGSWACENVSAGDYRIQVQYSGRPSGTGTAWVTLPADPSATLIDFGLIRLQANPETVK